MSLERLEQNANGDLIYTFTKPWSDSTSGIKFSPLERLEKLAALVPPPRVHQVREGGGVAPHSKLRAVIPPTPPHQGVQEASPGSSRWGVGQVTQAGMIAVRGAALSRSTVTTTASVVKSCEENDCGAEQDRPVYSGLRQQGR